MMSTDKHNQKAHVPVKPAFPYPGGKTRFLKHILPMIPEHSVYVEPFAGGLAVLLAKPAVKVEVVNDLNSELANFYRMVRFHCQALIDEIGWHLNSREIFYELREQRGGTELQRAARWYLLKVCSFGGMSETFGRGKNTFKGYDSVRHSELITEVSRRLSKVMVESQDWESVVTFWDGPDTFIFFDPPYVAAAKTAYDPFPEFEMERVRACLDQLQGQWILTCDDSPQCRRIFQGHHFMSVPIKYSTGLNVANPSPRKTSYELIVMSVGIAQERRIAA